MQIKVAVCVASHPLEWLNLKKKDSKTKLNTHQYLNCL